MKGSLDIPMHTHYLLVVNTLRAFGGAERQALRGPY